MVRFVDSKKMGRSMLGWLDSHFHFSFAEYHNPENINFGVLRVVNDDIIQPHTGFDMHPHSDMEILSYVIDGELTHTDSMGNASTLTNGHVQYMSAGTGVRHSEYNNGESPLRFLQIWILPNKQKQKPHYGEHRFAMEDRFNTWLPIATSAELPANAAPIRMHQDINIYATIITDRRSIDFPVHPGRQAYLILIDGAATVGSHELGPRDALEIQEESVSIAARDSAHVLLIEMAKQ